MILSFSTKFKDGNPTYFFSKIWDSLNSDLSIKGKGKYSAIYRERTKSDSIFFRVSPKRHTIRKDANHRWRKGMEIHFFFFNRSKNMFRFAPVIPCKGIQPIEIVYGDHCIDVIIDNTIYDSVYMHDDTEHPKLIMLALNDGFNNVDEFFEYFNKDFKGKIIHWTDLKY